MFEKLKMSSNNILIMGQMVFKLLILPYLVCMWIVDTGLTLLVELDGQNNKRLIKHGGGE